MSGTILKNAEKIFVSASVTVLILAIIGFYSLFNSSVNPQIIILFVLTMITAETSLVMILYLHNILKVLDSHHKHVRRR